MRPALTAPPDKTSPADPSCETLEDQRGAAIDARESRNFVVLVAYQIVLRMGWIFKTESIIMPAVLDSLGGAGWLRGCLPLLNRFGNSIPPLLFARRMKVMRRKKWSLAASTLLMSVAFLSLSAVWTFDAGANSPWLPIAFLSMYALFFVAIGLNQLGLSTLQGKLIGATHRGRMMLMSNVLGAIIAISCAWFLLPLWLTPNAADFRMIFFFSGVCFAVGAVVTLLIREPADHYRQPATSVARIFGIAFSTLRDDANFRRLAIVAALFGSSIMLFPHYQALGRDKLDIRLDSLILWVIVQNAGTGVFSLVAGPLADRSGNRLVLRCILLGVCLSPLVALALSLAGATGATWFWVVFLLVGLTPVTIKTLTNYTLEVAEPADHPRYLSTLSLCFAAPILLSPLVGRLVDLAGFELVFFGIAGLVFAAWLLTFTLREPRHHYPGQVATAPLSEQ